MSSIARTEVAVLIVPVAVAVAVAELPVAGREHVHPLDVLPVPVPVAVAVAVASIAGRERGRTDPRRRHPVAVAAGREVMAAVAVAVLERLIRPVAMGVPSTCCPWP